MSSPYISSQSRRSSQAVPKFEPTLASLRTSLSNLDAADIRELASLAQESDDDLFWSGLLSFGRRLQNKEKLVAAAAIYSAVKTSASEEPLRTKAQVELDAIEGRGAIGGRAEFLLSRFVKSASDAEVILPMMAGTAAFQLTKGAALGGMLAATEPAWWMRGTPGRLAASAFGFGVEVPVFAFSGRAMRSLENRAQTGLAPDLASAAITLGFLKLSGAGSQYLMEKALNRNAAPLTRIILSQTSMFGGLLAAHRAETSVGLRPHIIGATEVTDILSSMISMGMGAALGQRLLGSRYAGWQQDMGFRIQQAGEGFQGRPGAFLPNLATAGELRQYLPVPRPLTDRQDWQSLSKGGKSPDPKGSAAAASESESQWHLVKLQGDFSFSDPKRWNEAEIVEVIREIVAQDQKFYPTGDPLAISTGEALFNVRKYRVNGEDLSLHQLAGRVRQSRGLKATDRKALPDSEIVRGWKFRLIDGMTQNNFQESLKLSGEFRFADPKHWSRAEIGEVLKAIVSQDKQMYPDGDARLLSSDHKRYYYRWYRVNGEHINLQTLRRRWGGSIAEGMRGWKTQVFGLDFQATSQGSLKISGEFKPPLDLTWPGDRGPKYIPWAERDIDLVVKAIVAQDKVNYPEADSARMSTASRYFNRHYELDSNVGDWSLGHRDWTLNKLAQEVRRFRGFGKQDTKALTDAQIVNDWKTRLFLPNRGDNH